MAALQSSMVMVASELLNLHANVLATPSRATPNSRLTSSAQ